MATDWGEDADSRRIDRGLVRRVLACFLPYWRAALLALGCIAAGALLGLAPALVFRALIDYLADPDGPAVCDHTPRSVRAGAAGQAVGERAGEPARLGGPAARGEMSRGLSREPELVTLGTCRRSGVGEQRREVAFERGRCWR
jgi:hypothetical protein